MDAAQTEKLKALALAATPGPWSYEAEDNMISYDGYKLIAWQPRSNNVGVPQRCANGAFIAAANPATVLELIAEVERLRADAERFQKAIMFEDNVEALYAAVLNHAPDGAAIREEFDAAIAASKEKA